MLLTRLAICIPTHHGRAQTLRDLLESITRQSATLDSSEMEICVSDNASVDDTARMVGEFQSRLPIRLKYFRFDRDMRGVRNFVNVVDMAEAEYCWLVGSDDMIPPGGITNVLSALARLPGVPAMTSNKLNFDRTLAEYLGPDHDLVLPAEPSRSRVLHGLPEIAQNLGLSFTFMSAHVFRRHLWQNIVSEVGLDRLCATRHFPHSYILLRIAAAEGRWYWLAEYCVIQRMDNFCILEENNRHLGVYAEEITHDLTEVWLATLTSDVSRKHLMSRLFFLYWNPVAVFIYLADRRVTRSDQRSMRAESTRRFGALPLYWVTTYPMLCIPGFISKGIMRFLRTLDLLLPLRSIWEWTHGLLAATLSRFRSGDRDVAAAKSAASAFLDS